VSAPAVKTGGGWTSVTGAWSNSGKPNYQWAVLTNNELPGGDQGVNIDWGAVPTTPEACSESCDKIAACTAFSVKYA